MKIACTTLAAVAGTLAFTGSAAAFDRDVLAGNAVQHVNPTSMTQIPVIRAVDSLVRVDTEEMRSNVTRHPDINGALPIALGDCGDCDPGFITDNVSPLLGGGADVEPIVDMTAPFFTSNGLVNAVGSYDDSINDNYFDGLDPALLRVVPGPGVVCGFSATYVRTSDGANLREADTVRLNDVDLLANQANPGERLITISFTYAYDAFLDIQPAIGQDGFVARFTFGGDIGAGGTNFPGVQPFGTCESFTFTIDFDGFLDVGQEDYLFNIFPTFITPDGEPADVDYSLEFFAPPPTGACCVNGVGSEVVFEDCQTAGGVFWGVNTVLSQDGGLDGGVVCETCTLDPTGAFAESSSDNGLGDDVAGATDFNAGCGDFGDTGIYNPTPLDTFDFAGAPIAGGEVVLGARWAGTAYNYTDVNGAIFNDIDYYEFTAAANGTASVSIEADNPTIFQIVELGPVGDPCNGGAGLTVVGAGFAGDDDAFCTDSFLANVVAGQSYAVLVAPASAAGLTAFQPALIDPQDFIFNVFGVAPVADASAAENRYAFQVDIGVEQTGVCCFVDSSSIELDADCVAANGFFQGPGTTDTSVCCPDAWSGSGTLEGEDEICGVGPQPTATDINDGCADDNTFSATQPIAAGEVINGEHTTYVGLDDVVRRDRDVYTFTHSGGDVEVTFTAQFIGQLLLFDASTVTCIDGDFDNVDVVDAFNNANTCETGVTTFSLPAGDYAWFVSSLNAGGGVADPAADCNNGIPVPVRYALSWIPAVSCANGCTDTDGNGTVELADLLAVLADFGQAADADGTVSGGSGDQTDIDCNGAVELADLLSVLADFGGTSAGACP